MRNYKKTFFMSQIIIIGLLLSACSSIIDGLGFGVQESIENNLGEGQSVVLPLELDNPQVDSAELAASIVLTNAALQSITTESELTLVPTNTLAPTEEIVPESTVDTAQLTALANTLTAEVVSQTPTVQPPTETAAPTLEPTNTPTPDGWTPSPTPAECLAVRYVADVSIPDGSIIAPGAIFYKTWRVQNIGSCIWRPEFTIIYVGGFQLDARTPVLVGINVYPDQYVNLTLRLVAPDQNGYYRGDFKLKDTNGNVFGVGEIFNQPFYVEINVIAAD